MSDGKLGVLQARKGGVGKSWLCLQLANGMVELYNKKVLILTSDNQNNILAYAGINIEVKKGIEHWIECGKGDYIELRNNLYYIPLNSPILPKGSEHKFKAFIESLKKRFDYIFVDGTPLIDINTEFSNMADFIIIPTFLDGVTSISINDMMKKFGTSKVKAIIPNRAAPISSTEVKYYDSLKNVLKKTNILLTCPLKQSAIIGKLIDQGKTIYDSKSKKVNFIKKEIEKVLEVII
ncbi:ParA family protein [uncultured Fusobacterium sp.]|uniref:ParA family protein n=1 Tax=uncultured Fusobacterium sp. TaxID=159267 RepID=UPI0027DE0E00|nr:ParA family protein [uncultured Fusobacterium sp.]